MENMIETYIFGKRNADVFIWGKCRRRMNWKNVRETYLLGKCEKEVFV